VYEWPKGVSGYRKSVPLNPDLLEATRKFIKASDYTGVAMVEYKINQATGEWRFIEINGRFWGSLPLAVASGADFPRFLFELLTRGKRDFPDEYRKGVYCRNWLMDFNRLRTVKVARRHNAPSDSLLQTVLLALKNIFTFRERSDTFVLDDVMPCVRELSSWGWARFKGLGHKVKIKFLSLPGIRGAIVNLSLKKRLRTARTILFVCKGNICRSPFAGLYAKAILASSVEVISAGYLPPYGRSSPETAVEASRDFQVDLSPHRSQAVNEDMLDSADVVFIFDKENKDTLLAMRPAIKKKVHYLGLLKPGGSIIINDPYSGDVAKFKATYTTISSCISKIKSIIEAH
jgi:protein-tyrosine-phosphatase